MPDEAPHLYQKIQSNLVALFKIDLIFDIRPYVTIIPIDTLSEKKRQLIASAVLPEILLPVGP